MVNNDKLQWVQKAETAKNSWVYGMELFGVKDFMRGLKEKFIADDEGTTIRCMYGQVSSNLAALACNCDQDGRDANGEIIEGCKGVMER